MTMARNIHIYIDDSAAYIRSQLEGLYPRSIGVSSARSMQKIAGSRPVCTFFLTRTKRILGICTRMYAYVLIYTSLYIHDIHNSVYSSTNKYVLVHTSIYWYILVHTSTNRFMLHIASGK
jgi:hypothetical protein